MKVLLFGANGQLGWELQRTCPESIDLTAVDYPRVDFCNTRSIEDCIGEILPEVIINAAAYTAVDKAEQEQELAFKINVQAVQKIADICRQKRMSLVHISTDFVFSGRNFKPYTIEDNPSPESVYGKTKLEGEKAVIETLPDTALMIRTAWLYSSNGNNFVKTMLKFMEKKQPLNVIDEQVGTPTWAHGLAQSIWISIQKNIKGVFHWTDAGVASWYDFAVAIQEEGIQAGLLKGASPVAPISSDQYPTPAKRPFYSVLDKRSFWKASGLEPLHWRVQLRSMLKELV